MYTNVSLSNPRVAIQFDNYAHGLWLVCFIAVIFGGLGDQFNPFPLGYFISTRAIEDVGTRSR